VDCVTGEQIDAAISDLQALSSNVTVLTRSVDAAAASQTGAPMHSLTLRNREQKCTENYSK